MFPFEIFDPTQLAIIGVLLTPSVASITQLFKQTWPNTFVGVKVRWLAILVSLVLFGVYAGVQLAPEPASSILTWVFAGVTFALTASGAVDLAKEVVSKASNPLTERVG